MFVHTGNFSHAILVPTMVKYAYEDPNGVYLFGYTHLELYVNGGEGAGQDPIVGTGSVVPTLKLSDLGVVPEPDTWKLVSIPISGGYLKTISFSGRVENAFYIDDMSLVAAEPSEPSAVAESEAAVLPSAYGLSQNYPNPFNPTTTIAYDLPEASHVSLDLYNITGQHAATLVSKHHEAGSYMVSWDASGYASGLYFYRLQGGRFVQTGRMIHLK